MQHLYSPRRVLTLTAVCAVILAGAYFVGQAWAERTTPRLNTRGAQRGVDVGRHPKPTTTERATPRVGRALAGSEKLGSDPTAAPRSNASHPSRAPKPIAAPQSLLRARHACPNTASLVACRSALRKAYAAVEWQRRARNKASAGTSKDVVLDAIQWASHQTGVPTWQLTAIANCESHLFFRAHNGQYLGVWQLGATHRSDPVFDQVPWQDPYAQAIHVARFIKRHGESQWQCSSSGGLRW